VLIVRAAQQPHATGIMHPCARESVDVIEFHVASLRAPASAFIYERTAPAHETAPAVALV